MQVHGWAIYFGNLRENALLIFMSEKKTKKGKHIHIFMIFCIMGSTCLQLILQCTYNSVSIASNASTASLSAVSLSSFAQLLTWKHTNDEDDEYDVRA